MCEKCIKTNNKVLIKNVKLFRTWIYFLSEKINNVVPYTHLPYIRLHNKLCKNISDKSDFITLMKRGWGWDQIKNFEKYVKIDRVTIKNLMHRWKKHFIFSPEQVIFLWERRKKTLMAFSCTTFHIWTVLMCYILNCVVAKAAHLYIMREEGYQRNMRRG